VRTPHGDRSGEFFLLLDGPHVGLVDVLLQRGGFRSEAAQAFVDVHTQLVALFRGGRGQQHFLRAAGAQHVAAGFLGSAARNVALIVDGLRGGIQAADLREGKHADRQRADQQHREREAQHGLDREPLEPHGSRTAALALRRQPARRPCVRNEARALTATQRNCFHIPRPHVLEPAAKVCSRHCFFSSGSTALASAIFSAVCPNADFISPGPRHAAL